MLQNKVLRLLRSLDATEFKGFHRFLQSPFFNTNPRIVAFYDQLKKYYPVFDSPKLEREKLFAKLYPKKKYNYQTFANLITELTRLSEEYLIQLEFKNNKLQVRKNLATSYGKRDLFDLFEKESLNLVEKIKKSDAGESDLVSGYLLLKSYYFHTYQNKHSTDSTQLKKLMELLDNFYLEEKMVLASEIKNKANFLNTTIDIPLINPIKALLKDRKFDYRRYSYFLLLELLEKDCEENYVALEKYFLENHQEIKGDLKIIVFIALCNYCVRQNVYGHFKYYQVLFELNQFGLKNHLIVKENTIKDVVFINIILTAILSDSRNKTWILNFITKYQSYLKPSIREETVSLAFAALDFFIDQNYNKVIQGLINYKSNNPARNLTAKKILIRAHFEQFLSDHSYYDLLQSSCLSFERSLYRNDINESTKNKANLNFSVLIRKIAKVIYSNQFTKQVKKQLIQETEENDCLVSKYWFVNRLTELNPK